MALTRKKTTIHIDPELPRAAKVFAASTGRREYEVLEDALRHYLSDPQTEKSQRELRGLLKEFAGRSDLGDEEALNLAYSELHAARKGLQLD